MSHLWRSCVDAPSWGAGGAPQSIPPPIGQSKITGLRIAAQVKTQSNQDNRCRARRSD